MVNPRIVSCITSLDQDSQEVIQLKTFGLNIVNYVPNDSTHQTHHVRPQELSFASNRDVRNCKGERARFRRPDNKGCNTFRLPEPDSCMGDEYIC
jgi:hypothetical protein